ncbi:hypothetical protein RKE29_17515 [Streptomyces sp. B1866]|uniref:hypothetical protein n=1 Tax=Streptomyces sp. B1866 TaxID=3075431 RepID=UPI002891285E|nr:hypothetical protein [Streptomyces sp. B1866]MDT3398424.1 hypothetical protein [Streptomyces sp. B1866]
MSQPPPPPQPPQPPPGGFGAPQEPGYGYPQTPPPAQPGQAPPHAQPTQISQPVQPGYGYPPPPGQIPQPPQAPQTPPPAPQPGYGYPGQPPTHAMPTQVGIPAPPGPGAPAPYQQPVPPPPGYGYPQAPGQTPPPYLGGVPGAPGGGGGRPSGRQRMGVIVGAVVAVALVAVGGIWLATKDDGGSEAKDKDKGTSQGVTSGQDGGGEDTPPRTVDGRLLSTVPMPAVQDQVTAEGMWVTDKNFVKSGAYEIVGYPVAGGPAQWRIPLPGEVCWASKHVTSDGLTAVLFQPAKVDRAKRQYPRCSEVGLVDLRGGRMRWQRNVAGGDEKLSFNEVTIGAGTVAAGGTSGGAAWSLDGAQLWKPKPDEQCSDDGYAASETKLVAVRRCGEYDRPTLQVQTLDPKNKGAVKSSYKMSQGVKWVHIASVDPLVIAFEASEDVDVGGRGLSDVWAIDDSTRQGTVRGRTSVAKKYTAKCKSTNVEGCDQIVVSKSADVMFLATNPRYNSSTTKNEMVAVSLKSGQVVGKSDGVKEASVTPIGLDKDGQVLLYQESGYTQGGALWRLDPASYKKVKLLQNGAAGAQMEKKFSPEYQDFSYAGGRLYMGDHYATKPHGSFDQDDPLAAIFGAS